MFDFTSHGAKARTATKDEERVSILGRGEGKARGGEMLHASSCTELAPAFYNALLLSEELKPKTTKPTKDLKRGKTEKQKADTV